MIRSFQLADLFTIANAFCGIGAVFRAVRFVESRESQHLVVAVALIPLAMLFDFFDGRIARWRHESSPMGRELDSLADIISFGVAPAVIARAVGLDSVVDQALLMSFAACGVSRLARYNITADQLAGKPGGKVKYYEGTPITFSLIPLLVTLAAYRFDLFLPVHAFGLDFHLVTLLFFVSGCLMISKTIHIPKP